MLTFEWLSFNIILETSSAKNVFDEENLFLLLYSSMKIVKMTSKTDKY